MGENSTFHINDDGSVTVTQMSQLTENERNVIDILKIEKSKGGVFTSRRMKKRAEKYAKSIGMPEFKVEKLMMDNFPDDFANFRKTTSLIILMIIAVIFLFGAVFLSSIAWGSYNSMSWSIKKIEAIEQYKRTGYTENNYIRDMYDGYRNGYREGYREERIENDLIYQKDLRNDRAKDLAWSLFGVISCLIACGISLRQCQRISSSIKNK